MPGCRSSAGALLALGVLCVVRAAAQQPGTTPSPEAAPAKDAAKPSPSERLVEVRKLVNARRHAEAEEAARALLADVEAAEGPDSLTRADTLALLVDALTRGGKAKAPEARELAGLALALREKALGPEHRAVASSLDALASVLTASGDPEGARSHYERALAMREKLLGPDHADVAISLDNVAILLWKSGDYPGARPFFERALALRERTLGPEHAHVAHSLNNLAALLLDMGDVAGARPLHERALAIREKVLGPESPDVAASLQNLAMLLYRTGDFDRAKSLAARAVAIKEKTLGPDHPSLAMSLQNLAAFHHATGDLESAEALFRRAIAIKEKALGPDDLGVAGSLNNLAAVLADTGDLTTARRLMERALSIREKALGTDHPDVARALQNLSTLYRTMGDSRAAMPLAERALASYEKALGPTHVDVAVSLDGLAALLADQGDIAGARRLRQRGLAIRQEMLGPDHPDNADSLTGLATLHVREGGGAANARPLLERALAIREKALGSEHLDVAESLSNLAVVLDESGEHGLAEPLFERALAIWRASVGEDHPHVAGGLNSLAIIACAEGDAVRALDLAVQAEDVSREHVRVTSRALSERLALLHVAKRASGLDVAISAATSEASPLLASRAWDAAVRSRALVLDEMVARRRDVVRSRDPRIGLLAREHAAAAGRLASLTVRGPAGESPERFRQLLNDARHARDSAEEALAAESAAFRDERSRRNVALADVVASLAPRDALVAFVRHDRHEVARRGAPGSAPRPPMPVVPSYAAFVLRSAAEDPVAVALGPADEIEALVEAWRREATRGDGDEGACRAAGEKLRRAAWDPVATHLSDAKRVFVVPDGALNLVSLPALPAEGGGYLVEETARIHLVSAERDLVRSPSAPSKAEGLLALGGPAFDDTSSFAAFAPAGATPRAEPLAIADARIYRGGTSQCGDFATLRFQSLPGAEREAAEVAALWQERAGGAATSAVLRLSRAAASEAAFKAAAPGRRVLHLATHGFFLGAACGRPSASTRGFDRVTQAGDARAPDAVESQLVLSGLALAGANRRSAAGEGDEDGILTAEEIATLDLGGVEWAVLSACDSGLGDIRAGEGVFGLRRAFQLAGASSVIMSLWAVDDEATRDWMMALYEARLGRGRSTAECVRDASLSVLRKRRAAGLPTHPFTWAGFVATGDWR